MQDFLNQLNLTSTQLVYAAIAFFAAGLLQSIASFGFAIFAVPILLWIGIDLEYAIAIVLTAMCGQTFHSFWKLREKVRWKEMKLPFIVRTLAMIPLIFLTVQIQSLPQDSIKFIVGLVILFLTLFMMTFAKKEIAFFQTAFFTYSAFIISGILVMICGMGGPPIVIWAMAQSWDAQEVRATLFAIFNLSVGIVLGIFVWQFGTPILYCVGLGIIGAPFASLGSMLGHPIGEKLEKPRQRMIAYALLLIISFQSMGIPGLFFK